VSHMSQPEPPSTARNPDSAPDTVLARMADFADSAKAGIYVTLIIPGGVISGVIESAQGYFRAVSSSLREGVAQHGDERLNKVADDYAGLFFYNVGQPFDDQVETDKFVVDEGDIPTSRRPLARYIHLADAYITVPGQYAFELGHVRLLLSQVIGWTVGEKRTVTQPEQSMTPFADRPNADTRRQPDW
jgi:hypothetical protein